MTCIVGLAINTINENKGEVCAAIAGTTKWESPACKVADSANMTTFADIQTFVWFLRKHFF